MKKSVLIISGIPRKGGNTDLLCDAFARGAEEAGGRVEKIFGEGLTSGRINEQNISSWLNEIGIIE